MYAATVIHNTMCRTRVGRGWSGVAIGTNGDSPSLEGRLSTRGVAEGIGYRNIEQLEVPGVPGSDHQTMNSRRRGDDCVLKERIGSAFHQPRPFTKDGPIGGNYLCGAGDPIDPGFDFIGFSRVLPPCALYARLQFAE